MTNKTLGAIAMCCAPFLCLDFLVHGFQAAQDGPALSQTEGYQHTSLSGVFSLIYMIGWVCSIVVLKRIRATGFSKFGSFILNAQLFTLTLANVWNIYEIISPAANTTVYFVLDLFWPLSQVVLLAIGIMVMLAGVIEGRGRFIPLLAGFWFLPFSILLMVFIGQNYLTMILSGVYSAVAWGMMGWMCFRVGEKEYLLQPVGR